MNSPELGLGSEVVGLGLQEHELGLGGVKTQFYSFLALSIDLKFRRKS